MKTKITITTALFILSGFSPINIISVINAQEEIYYTPSKKSEVNNTPTKNEIKDSVGMTNYEKYCAMKEKSLQNDPQVSTDTSLSHEDLAKKKGMTQYNEGYSAEIDSTSPVNGNQNYSQNTAENPQQGNTVVNNYYSGNDYPFGWYHNFYFDYCYDPFFYPYDYWGLGFYWGWPYLGFGWSFPGYYYGYAPYNYWGYPNYYGRNYGGARRSMGGYRSPSGARRASLINNNALVEGTFGRRLVSDKPITPVTENGATYDDARRKAWQTYQTKNVNPNNVPNRREPNAVSRYKAIQTTRPNVISKNYTPSYNTTSHNSTRPLYNENLNYRNAAPKDNGNNKVKAYSPGTGNGTNQVRARNSYSNYTPVPHRSNEVASSGSYVVHSGNYSGSSSHNVSSGGSHSSGNTFSSGSSSHEGGGSHSGGGGRR